jgi:uncharacterized membrane protein
MSIKETINNLTIQGVIALLIICVGFAFLAFVPAKESVTVSIVNLMIMVVSYYFGSSRSTSKKDETIANMIDKK